MNSHCSLNDRLSCHGAYGMGEKKREKKGGQENELVRHTRHWPVLRGTSPKKAMGSPSETMDLHHTL